MLWLVLRAGLGGAVILAGVIVGALALVLFVAGSALWPSQFLPEPATPEASMHTSWRKPWPTPPRSTRSSGKAHWN